MHRIGVSLAFGWLIFEVWMQIRLKNETKGFLLTSIILLRIHN